MGAYHVTLDSHEIAITWSEMYNGFHSDMLLNQASGANIAHTHTSHRIVGDVNDVNATLTHILSVVQKLGEFYTSWWQHLCTHDKVSFSQQVRQVGGMLWCRTTLGDFRFRLRHDYVCLRGLGRYRLHIQVRCELPERLAHRSDMARSGPAAPSEQAYPSVKKPMGRGSEILGGRYIDKPASDSSGQASIWLSCQQVSIRHTVTHAFNDLQGAGRAKRAVDANDIGSQFAHRPGHSGRLLATHHGPIFTESHARDDGDGADAAHRGERLAHFRQV